MTHRLLFYIFCSLLTLCACIEDGFTVNPNDQPVFSNDTLDLGLVYTSELTTTSRMTVRNPHDKGLNISEIALSGEAAQYFRINVDGISGTSFSNMEIRANDSIYVFVEAHLPENGKNTPVVFKANMDFLVNGRTSSVVLLASGQDIVRIVGEVLSEPTIFKAGCPYQIKDSLVIDKNASLTIEAGSRVLMHDKAYLKVLGNLIVNGTHENPVVITGDRTGNLLPDVSFDIMSRQWEGIFFFPGSHDNLIQYCEISNTCYGVEAYGDENENKENPMLTLVNCRLRNSGLNVLTMENASVNAYGCEFAEAAAFPVYLSGGNHRFEQCTFSNYYLYSAPSYALIGFDFDENSEEVKATIVNSILYGLSVEVNEGDLTGREIYFNNCLFRSEGVDDENFIQCKWGLDPLFFTVRNDYYFDYRLQEESPAVGMARPELNKFTIVCDYYGKAYTSSLGAFQ